MKNYFWVLDHERKSSPKVEEQHNGRFEIEYGMPCFWCCDRRATIGWINAELPAEYRDFDEFSNRKNIDVTFERFSELKRLLLDHPNFSNIAENELKRGCWMFPGEFTPPDFPSDFAWSVTPGPIVSKKVFDVLSEHASGDFSFREVEGGYYFIFVKHSGKPPLEKRSGDAEICPRCGYAKGMSQASRYIFEEDMWPGSALFDIEGATNLFVTDDLKEELDRLHPTNVIFRRVDVGSSYSAAYLKRGVMF